MKKRVFGKSLSRDFGSRRALYRSHARALIAFGVIRTTVAKAKAVQGLVEKMVTIAKRGTLDAKRRIYSLLGNDRKSTETFFEKVVPALLGKSSGYTRLVKLQPRRGDGAEMARLEWSEKISLSEQSKSKKEKIKGKKEAQERNEPKSAKVRKRNP